MRNLKVKVKSAKGRTTSSTRWLQRQLNDPLLKRQDFKDLDLVPLLSCWKLTINSIYLKRDIEF